MTKLNFTSNNFSHSHQNQYIVNCAPMHRTESCTRQFHIILFNVLFNVQICFWVESVFIEFVELNLIFQSVDYRNWCFLFPMLNLQIQIVWARSLLNRLVKDGIVIVKDGIVIDGYHPSMSHYAISARGQEQVRRAKR